MPIVRAGFNTRAGRCLPQQLNSRENVASIRVLRPEPHVGPGLTRIGQGSGQQREEVVAGDPSTRTRIAGRGLRQCALALLQLEHALLHRVGGHEPLHEHRPVLADAVGAVGGLVFDGGVPPWIEQEHVVGGGQVEPGPAGLERQQQHRRTAGVLVTSLLTLALSACMVGPDHVRPTLSTPAQFANDEIFEPIRIEPYLRAAASRHPALAPRLEHLASTTMATKQVLVHGDVSPKNILCGPDGPVFLDAECAWYGDPAFDLAFCLNHLLLKGSWQPQWKARYLACFERLSQAYLAAVNWESPEGFEARCAALLPGLWLARNDGKSPVEYLTDEPRRQAVRDAARRFLEQPVANLGDIADFWSRQRDT